MRTAQECLAKAMELQARADACQAPDMKQRFQYLADCWRDLTREDGQFGPMTLLDFP